MKSEIIVEAGAEGGGITLYGQRNGRGWLFSRHLVDHTGAMLEDPVWIEHDSEVVSTWEEAINLLEEYEFNHLHPLQVHPEFQDRVLREVLSRNRRSRDTHCQENWYKACGMLDLNDLKIELKVEVIEIPKSGTTQGQLLAANPSFTRPANIAKEDWAHALLKQAMHQVGDSKSVLAVPRSFWPSSREALDEYAKSEGFEFVDLMDEWDGPNDFGFMTPVESMRQIRNHLLQGENVIVLSNSTKASDFVRSVLYLVSQEYAEHPTKMWCGIAKDGRVELSQFQRGYLYGLMNANGSFGLEQLKIAFRERSGC